MEKGILANPLKIEEVLSSRIFRTHCDLGPLWGEYYDRVVETRALRVNRRHELRLAY